MDGKFTDDSLFDGRLVCRQHKDGYRFSVDAVLLAHFISPKPEQKILDLGAGCGVVSLVLACRWPGIHLTALELQPHLVDLIVHNIRENSFEDRMQAVAGDLRNLSGPIAPGGFDWVVCNPPYRKHGTGRRNPGEEEALARHEINADLHAVLRAASYAVRTRGRVALVYPASRAAGLIAELKSENFEPKRLQVVHSYPESPGKLVLVEAVKNGGEELTILPPFYVYKEPGGDYSEEMARCYVSN